MSADTATSVADTEAEAWALLATVTDPEIPVVTLQEMGIIRDLQLNDAHEITVVITPTYSGCPAMDQIRVDIADGLRPLNRRVVVQTQLSPAWTTDWMTAAAKEKLRGYGIAPPNRRCGSETEPVSILRFMREAAVASDEVSCPQCGSIDTVESSHFGSTPCKALYKCLACTEPFDYFKPF